jgi:hypothetical protein
MKAFFAITAMVALLTGLHADLDTSIETKTYRNDNAWAPSNSLTVPSEADIMLSKIDAIREMTAAKRMKADYMQHYIFDAPLAQEIVENSLLSILSESDQGEVYPPDAAGDTVSDLIADGYTPADDLDRRFAHNISLRDEVAAYDPNHFDISIAKESFFPTSTSFDHWTNSVLNEEDQIVVENALYSQFEILNNQKVADKTNLRGQSRPQDLIEISLYVHVLADSSGGGAPSSDQISRQVDVLNADYHGAGFVFNHKGTTVTKKDSWNRMQPYSSDERAAKIALRVGDAKTLNVYINNNP